MITVKNIQDRKCASGFSLVELLTVIVIIGVLAGLISSAIIHSKRRALAVERAAEKAAIENAIRNYRYEYQEWPCEVAGTYKNNNRIIIHDWLASHIEGRNERKITFLNLADYRFDGSSNVVDYTGTPYEIIISFDGDNVKVN